MPIYEFYCDACHTIFNFFSRTVNTTKIPSCPRCGRALQRRASLFSCIDPSREDNRDVEDLPIDESRLAEGMQKLEREVDRLNEDNPKEAARMLRKFSDMTGIRFNDMFQKAISRLESGESPEEIEQDMGDALESEDPFIFEAAKRKAAKKPPAKDDTLYEL
jgi:putative FmdB family regulatory protein